MESGGAGVSFKKLEGLLIGDSAVYKCTVNFGGDFGTRTGKSLKQYVRSVESGVTQYAAIIGVLFFLYLACS